MLFASDICQRHQSSDIRQTRLAEARGLLSEQRALAGRENIALLDSFLDALLRKDYADYSLLSPGCEWSTSHELIDPSRAAHSRSLTTLIQTDVC